jgi:uncharacterized protein
VSVAGILLFLALLVIVLGAINLHVFRWARNAFALGRTSQRWLMALLVAAPVGMILGRVAGRLWPGPAVTSVIAVSSSVELAVIISCALLLLIDAARLLWSGLLRLLGTRTAGSSGTELVTRERPESATAELGVVEAPAELPRRAFLTQAAAGSAFLIGSSSSLYGSLHGRLDYAVEEVEVSLAGMSRALDGFSIVQLSDVHIGAFTGAPELAAAEELVRNARPDLIVLTGDLLDNDARLAEQLARFVRRLSPLARHGVVAVSGNHDYFAGIEDMARAVRDGGGTILRNQGLVIGDAQAGFALLGVDDVWARRRRLGGPDLARAVASLPRLGGQVARALDLPRVLLCHNPSFFSEAAGEVALQVSGHTHGGQVNFGVRPADYVLPGGWVAGRYDAKGSMLYVNRGFGTVGPPARLGAQPEVTRLVLTA